jgi:putative ABC transport system permease protein
MQAPQVNLRMATPDYFHTLGQSLLTGRLFRTSDVSTEPPVAIVSQSAAKEFWPGEDPVGTRLVAGKNGAGQPQFVTVVGVVTDVRQSLDHSPAAEVYVPLRQTALGTTMWILKSDLPPADVERAIRTAAHAQDADLPVTKFRTLAEVRSITLTPRRVIVALIGLFGLLALVITAAGIAGVVAFSVNQRTHEFGLRMALGARRGRVVSMVVREGIVLVATGMAIGLVGAAALTKVLGRVLLESSPQANGPFLFDVQPTDVLTYVGVAAVLLLVAVAACVLPARRAASVDPMIALRAQ